MAECSEYGGSFLADSFSHGNKGARCVLSVVGGVTVVATRRRVAWISPTDKGRRAHARDTVRKLGVGRRHPLRQLRPELKSGCCALQRRARAGFRAARMPQGLPNIAATNSAVTAVWTVITIRSWRRE